ncbi:MAG: hypothetical protein CHACPFDD_03831 [Phycisphaerae bacterium]|nr:hypothetical protein [Phycisphaerae bacterium]
MASGHEHGHHSSGIAALAPLDHSGRERGESFVDPWAAHSAAAHDAAHAPVSLLAPLRYKWTLIITTLLVAVPLTVAIWALYQPAYRAQAIVRVRPIVKLVVFETPENSGTIPLYNNYLNTQVSVIRSPRVLNRVLELPAVQATRWFQDHKHNAPALLNESLVVMPRNKTELIDVSVTTEQAKDAAVLANSVVDEYIRFVNGSPGGDGSDAEGGSDVLATLSDLEERYHRELETLKTDVRELRRELQTSTPDHLLSQKIARVDQMQAEANTLDRDIMVVEYQLDIAQKLTDGSTSRPSSAPADAALATKSAYRGDAEWRRLWSDLKTSQLNLDLQRNQLGEQHPGIIAARKRVELAEEMLAAREAQLDNGVAPSAGASPEVLAATDPEALKRQVELLKKRRDVLARDLKSQHEEYRVLFEKAASLKEKEEQCAKQQELYDAVKTRRLHLDTERQRPASIMKLAQAVEPTKPDGDKRKIYTVAALLGSIVAGFAVAFARSRLTQSLHGARELATTARTPFLGQLPGLRRPQNPSPQERVAQAECIRMVRTALLQRIGHSKGATILITSAGLSTGKTTCAALLGRSLAQAGKRVLLVDADVRRPALRNHFECEPGPGLIPVLERKASDDAAISRTETDGLSVLLGVRHEQAAEAAELLADGAFESALRRWRERFDVVLIDTAPVLPVADTRMLARHVDGAIMVVRENHCRRNDVIEALACLGAAGTKLLGTVFIGSGRRSGYGSSYSYGYTYA